MKDFLAQKTYASTRLSRAASNPLQSLTDFKFRLLSAEAGRVKFELDIHKDHTVCAFSPPSFLEFYLPDQHVNRTVSTSFMAAR